jgi:membrane-associated phospholipid phosphatase
LAEVLNPAERYWAVDKIILAYFTLMGALLAVYWGSVPGAAELLALHVAGAALIVLAVKWPGRASRLFHHWYALLYVASTYREMSILIPAIRRTDADQWLANADHALWHANPTVWLERIQVPPLTEFLQIVYSLFIPAVLFVAVLLWLRKDYAAFRYYAFLIATGFLVSYIGYLLVPARGPRFILKDLQHAPLRGLWLFGLLQSTLDQLEHVTYDCFPSGHTELAILACWGSRQISRPLGRVYVAYTVCMVFATVYLRYHYTVDVAAGAFLALVLIFAMPALYRKLS